MRQVFVIGRFVDRDGDEQWRACYAVPDRWIASRLVTFLLHKQLVSDAYLMSDREVARRLGAQRLIQFQAEADLFEASARGRAVTNMIEQQVELGTTIEDALRERTRELRSVGRDLELLLQEAFDSRVPLKVIQECTRMSRQQLLDIRRRGYLPEL